MTATHTQADDLQKLRELWGRWQTFGRARSAKSNRKNTAEALTLPEKDRRERARIVVEGGAAALLSAPIFNVGAGNPYDKIENLATLGPDVLPYNKKFDSAPSFCAGCSCPNIMRSR